jgi:hypothetical protein
VTVAVSVAMVQSKLITWLLLTYNDLLYWDLRYNLAVDLNENRLIQAASEAINLDEEKHWHLQC